MTELSWRDVRVLAALQLRDAVTRTPVSDSLEVSSDGLVIARNRSGLWVVARARGFSTFADAFFAQPPLPAVPAPDAVPADQDFTVHIDDPTRRWLPRLARVVLPRNPDPAQRTAPSSLFQPIVIDLLPAPAASIGSPWWAVLRVHARRAVAGGFAPLAGAWVRARRSGGDQAELGRALTDARGEGLLCVPALPAVTFAGPENDDGDDIADAPVTTPDTAAVIEAVWDPTAAWPLDPDRLSTHLPMPNPADTRLRTSQARPLRAGLRDRLTLTLTAA
jgi:hypothetical protein